MLRRPTRLNSQRECRFSQAQQKSGDQADSEHSCGVFILGIRRLVDKSIPARTLRQEATPHAPNPRRFQAPLTDAVRPEDKILRISFSDMIGP